MYILQLKKNLASICAKYEMNYNNTIINEEEKILSFFFKKNVINY